MKFNSQICTTKEQSERLLALGLKKDTADMCWFNDMQKPFCAPYKYFAEKAQDMKWVISPAWSLHRLIEIMPNKIIGGDSVASLIVSNEKVQYYLHDVEYSDYLTSAGRWKSGNIYDDIIDCIAWLIITGCFNIEYLEGL